MATQQLLQLQPCKQEQQVSQTLQSQTQQASAIVFPVMAWAGAAAAGRPSSPGDPALYDVHSNNQSGSDGSQLSHGHNPTATSQTAATAGDGDASWEVRAFAEDSASCSGQWPPRSYACSFCRREFRTAQALGGHMNVHRRERAQANNMAILRSTAQQAAAAATAAAAVATPQQLAAVAGPNGQAQWCLYSPMGVGVNPAAIAAAASPERRAFFYSSLAPGGAILTMTSSSGGSSQFASRSSRGPSPPSHGQYNNNNSKNAGMDSNQNNNVGGMFINSGVQISSSLFPTSPMSSPASQGSGSSGSSVITKSGSPSAGSQDHDGAGGSPPYRSSSSVSGDSTSFAQKLQLGAFQPYQSSPFAHDAAPLVTQELIQLRPQHLNSSIFAKSMGIRGPTVDDVAMLDLELRLGPA
ncbi:unnamed protein product [Calypogeia fissa]